MDNKPRDALEEETDVILFELFRETADAAEEDCLRRLFHAEAA